MFPTSLPALALALGAGILACAGAGPFTAAPLPWLAAALLAGAIALELGGRRRAWAVALVVALAGGALAARERGRRVAPPAGAVADDRGEDPIAGVVAGAILD